MTWAYLVIAIENTPNRGEQGQSQTSFVLHQVAHTGRIAGDIGKANDRVASPNGFHIYRSFEMS